MFTPDGLIIAIAYLNAFFVFTSSAFSWQENFQNKIILDYHAFIA